MNAGEDSQMAKARTLDELIALAAERQVQSPGGWARRVLEARKRKGEIPTA